MLKALMIRKKLDDATKALDNLRKSVDFEARSAELEADIAEANTEEEQKVVEEAIEAFEKEKTEHAEKEASLEKEIADLNEELNALEDAQAERSKKAPEQKQEARKVDKPMEIRRFSKMSYSERCAFFEREDMKEFISNIRAMGQQKRSITNAGYTIPRVALEMIKADIEQYSKLYKHVLVKQVVGESRTPVLGSIPEAIWTEATAAVNELSLSFAKVDLDGYKVAGYIPVANAILEDNDVDLGSEVMAALGQSLGYALDKAIVFGTNSNMPKGIYAGTKADNKVTHAAADSTGSKLFKNIVADCGLIKHFSGSMVWVMNHKTKMAVLAESVGVNANAAIVAGMNSEMPVVGGTIEELDFIPDNVIIGGDGKRYLLGERKEIKVAYDSSVQFIADNTVFKATGRYDGEPVFDDSFVVIGINAQAVNALSVTFASA